MFFNLGCLSARVKACVTHLADQADAAASAALHPAALEEAASAARPTTSSSLADRSSSPPKGSSAAGAGGAGGRAPTAREAGAAAARRRALSMRAHAGKLAAAIHTTSMEAWGLQRVLEKKRDPTTRALLDSAVRADRTAGLSAGAYSAYWDGLCRAVRGAVERTLAVEGVDINGIGIGGGGYGGGRATAGGGNAGGGGGGEAVLVAMYPYLRKAFLHLIRRLEEGTRGGDKQHARVIEGGGIGVAGTAAVTAGILTSIPGGGNTNGGLGSGGILGGSRWLSLAFDNETDSSSDEAQSDIPVAAVASAGNAEAGAESGAGPTTGNNRGNTGLWRKGVAGRGGEADGETGGAEAATGSSNEGATLLEALGPLRDLFLARSLERLTIPVEQMFPQVWE